MIGAELATCACGRPGNHRGMCTVRWSRVRGDQPLRTRRPTGETRSNMAKRRFKQYAPGGGCTLSPDHPAAIEGSTLFPNRRTASALTERLLKSGEHNAKIGAMVVKGPLAGAKVFTLTLEERATCPRSCALWAACYGNNMNWPQRIQADADLMPLLEAELRKLHAQHGRILVRLHVLGDFFSTEYVHFWRSMLELLPGLHVYGYTARNGCDIGIAIHEMNEHPRCWIRFSDGEEGQFRAVTVDSVEQAREAGAIVCPAQHHSKADQLCCSSCALCWATPKTIAFLRH